MNDPEQDVIEYKVRRAVGINALRKIGAIVAEEQKIDADKDKVLRRFARFGWIVLLGTLLLLAYLVGLI